MNKNSALSDGQRVHAEPLLHSSSGGQFSSKPLSLLMVQARKLRAGLDEVLAGIQTPALNFQSLSLSAHSL